jgi:peptidoglycan/xylan/chitin deacetylase (PgdA/CDA1 family)
VRAASLVRKAAKGAVLPRGMISGRRPGDVVILLYHRVGAGEGEIALPVEAFERQLEYLSQRETVLELDAALADGSAGGVVVTFDDGYRDFHEHALPLLVRYRIPAVLYLTTGGVASDATAAWSGPDALTWSQLDETLGTGLMTVGAHTHSHADLSRASERTATEELRRSKELVEDRLGVACRHFAYPWAVGSPAADRAARALFDTAARHAWRTNRRGRIDPYELGRTPILRSDGSLFFRAKARGLLDGEAILYRALGRGPWQRP